MTIRLPHLVVALAASSLAVFDAGAQVAVDADGQPYEDYELVGDEALGTAAFTPEELDSLVASIALYPDDLLAIVLPAATYPLQIVEAGRFLDALESDPSLAPDDDWDDAVVALLNYPEVIELLNEDLDWTWQLGEAVVSQQDDVIAAVEAFRNRAYAAGNLRTDEYQEVSHDEGIIEILPVSADIIHVPYYEPERVVVAQSVPVYHYYEQPRPVYYYPYAGSHAFRHGYFWGVTTAYSIAWSSDRLRVYHSSYRSHPYFGRRYHDRWWYRRPSISVHRSIYSSYNVSSSVRRFDRGDYWRPNRHVRLRRADQRITRSHYYPHQRTHTRSAPVRSRRATPDRMRVGNASGYRPDSRDTRRRIEQRLNRQPTTRIRRPGSAPQEIRREPRARTEHSVSDRRRTVGRPELRRERETTRRSDVRRSQVQRAPREQRRPKYQAPQSRERVRQPRAERRTVQQAKRAPARDRGSRGQRRKVERQPR